MAKFEKGKSGNPKGRRVESEVKEVKEIAKRHTKAAIDKLVFWMNSNQPKASVAASIALLDRGWGRPSQELEHSGSLTVNVNLNPPDGN